MRDIYLGYGSEIIAAFFSGHCNGWTRSPSEAGWSPIADRPYLQGVPCICGRTTYYGHAIGMCQRGAEAMALGGASFDAILRHYYTGVQLLGLDESPPSPQRPPANATTYTVQPGDTLSGIGAAFGIPWQAIHAANATLIADPDIIEVGWVLGRRRLPAACRQVQVALLTGLRLGELLGLRWQNVDFDQAVLRVQQTCQWLPGRGFIFRQPKRYRSVRPVALSPDTVERLRQCRVKLLEERLAAGTAYEDRNLVFAHALGAPIHPSTLRGRGYVCSRKRAWAISASMTCGMPTPAS